jgi:hypothetical protein
MIYNSTHKLNIVPILIGSQQTQHVESHKDDLDHVGQLTRSKHEAHGGGDNHLATAMDPYSKVDYSHITPEATMVVEKASGRVPGRAPRSSRYRDDDGGGLCLMRYGADVDHRPVGNPKRKV